MTTLINKTSHTRKALDKTLRSGLERTVIKARDIAEEAASQALKRLAVADKSVPDYFSDEQKTLRNRLRAHGRQLGDIRLDNGEQSVHKLVIEVAYEHWHRMLFARFLEQNSLLMYDQHTMVTLQDCNDLIEEQVFRDNLEQACTNGWELAGVLASKMLPQIFRTDSPVFQFQFALELQRELETLVMGLAPEIFQAQDSLGWVYQFWQSKRKEEVNKSEVKIGADELSPVTQLFTEPYMVSFLLDNSLGAWWAGKRLSEDDWINCESEQVLRAKAAIPGVPLEYLRFVKENDRWQPASGFFEGWPSQLSELKTLDPCCGSGHFLVAAFLMLVPMRMELESLSAKDAVDRVLEENLHGLELDQRCVELAAFAVALEAWRYPNTGGYRTLPELHLACSGLSISAAKDEWKELSKKAGKQNLTIALDWMYQTFKDAPVLGSLINPKRLHAAKITNWDELDAVLTDILTEDERIKAQTGNEIRSLSDELEAGIVAQGLVKAAKLLSMQYSWVITNVPYLARGKQDDVLRDYCEVYYPEGKNDLANVFLDRCLEFCHNGGTSSIVLPQNWLFLTSYRKFREKLLQNDTWNLVARLGAQAFQTPMWDFNVQLITLSRGSDNQSGDLLGNDDKPHMLRGVDVSTPRTAAEKAAQLITDEVKSVSQAQQLENPDALIVFHEVSDIELLLNRASVNYGSKPGQTDRVVRYHWEFLGLPSKWQLLESSPSASGHYSGKEKICLTIEQIDIQGIKEFGIRGKNAWGHLGVIQSQMQDLPFSIYCSNIFDNNTSVILPNKIGDAAAIFSFIESGDYLSQVRKLNQKLDVAAHTMVKVPYDHQFWRRRSEFNYPKGLPRPYTNNPTQWLFHGHPCGSVVWDEEQKWTVESDLRVDDTVLQVAVARLLGYQWPAELDADMELGEEQRAWVERCKTLAPFVDDDGIVCLPAVRGEKAAELRLEAMLEAAYGDAWTTPLRNHLLQTVGSKSLAAWLRDKFFEQHCKLFQHRPFIWQIWDGLKDGFSVLVNYHKLDKAGLERLIYTYLGDWIRTQQAEVANGVDGADVRLGAAQALKQELENILAGEKPYDIFVRWKPGHEQPIGWNPDLNDGVRLNIRPFMLAKDMGKKGAGILRAKPNIHWQKDRGTDIESAPWYDLGLQYGEKEGARINEHHLTLAEKHTARDKAGK